MTSKLIVNSVRHTGASADGITMAADGSVTFPGNATCSGTATGFGGGKIKQVVYKNISNNIVYSSLSSSYADATNFNLAITPTSATNLLYFQLNIAGCLLYDTSGSDHRAYLGLSDDGASSYLQENQFRMYEYGGGYHLGLYLMKSYTITHIKTAGSTSARTYQLRAKITQGEQFELNANGTDVSTMVIWEIEP